MKKKISYGHNNYGQLIRYTTNEFENKEEEQKYFSDNEVEFNKRMKELGGTPFRVNKQFIENIENLRRIQSEDLFIKTEVAQEMLFALRD